MPRSEHLSRAGLGRGLALLPGIDFANHDDGIKFSVQKGDGVFSSEDSVLLVADRDYAEGEQVWRARARVFACGCERGPVLVC